MNQDFLGNAGQRRELADVVDCPLASGLVRRFDLDDPYRRNPTAGPERAGDPSQCGQ